MNAKTFVLQYITAEVSSMPSLIKAGELSGYSERDIRKAAQHLLDRGVLDLDKDMKMYVK